MDFAPAPGDEPAIRYGLSAVRNVGQGAVQQILDARRREGRVRVVRGLLPQGGALGAVEAGAGGADPRGRVRLARDTRGGALHREARRRSRAPIAAERKAEAAGQFSLFGGGGDDGAGEIDESVLDGEEFDKRTLLRAEKEMLGQFVTDHPLLGGARRRWRRRPPTRSATS